MKKTTSARSFPLETFPIRNTVGVTLTEHVRGFLLLIAIPISPYLLKSLKTSVTSATFV